MTLLSALTTLAAVLGTAIWRGWGLRWLAPHYRPVVLLLWLAPLSDAVQAGIGHVLADHPVPYSWPTALTFHVDATVLILWPCAMVATGVVVFCKRSPLPAFAAWLVLAAALALAYPELRLSPRWTAYGVLTGLCCAAVWVMAWRTYCRVDWLLHHRVLLLLSIGTAASSAAYYRPDPPAEWMLARAPLGAAFAVVICYQLAQICRDWRPQ